MRLSENLKRASSLYGEAMDRLSYRIDSLTPDTVQVMKDEVKAARALAKQARKALDQHGREHGCLSVEQLAACGGTGKNEKRPATTERWRGNSNNPIANATSPYFTSAAGARAAKFTSAAGSDSPAMGGAAVSDTHVG